MWRLIMNKAERAKELMLQDRVKGELEFNELLDLHGPDGMIYFDRADAYERLGVYDLAYRDYQSAESYFPMEKWKKAASAGAARVKRRM